MTAPRRGWFWVWMLASLLPAVPASAQSLWNAEGMGGWNEPFDLAARGQGGTSIGRADTRGMSAQNPASQAWLRSPHAIFGVLAENSWASADGAGAAGRTLDTRLPGMRVVVPAGPTLVLGAGFRDLTIGTYRSRQLLNGERGDALHREIEGSGSLGLFSVSGAARLLQSRLAVGFEVGVASGTLRERIVDDFVSGAYIDGRNLLRTRYLGAEVWSFGVQAKAGPRLTLGGFYGPRSSRFDVRSILEARSGVREEHRGRQALPSGYGWGASFAATPRLHVALDWVRRNWSESRFESSVYGSDPGGREGVGKTRNTNRFGIGLEVVPPERSPKDPLLSRSTFRFGFSRGALPVLQAGGGEVNEWALSAGIGLPVQVDRGSLDVSLEVGRRGARTDTGLQETFARLGLGITFSRLRESF